MAKYCSPAFLDGGLNYLKANAVTMALIKNYAAGDSTATVAANILATVAMTSADYVLSTSGSARVITPAAKTTGAATQSSGASPNLHVAHLDNTGAPIYVTDETSDQVVTAGNPIDIPAHTYTINQPT